MDESLGRIPESNIRPFWNKNLWVDGLVGNVFAKVIPTWKSNVMHINLKHTVYSGTVY